jgi:serine protease
MKLVARPRIRILEFIRITMLVIAAVVIPSANTAFANVADQALRDLAMEQAEERELVVAFRPEVLRLEIGGTPSVLRLLEARHPELKHVSMDSAGYHRFVVQPADAPRIDEFRASIARLGGTVGKLLPSARIQALYKARLQARRMGEPDVLGIIVKYRAQEKRGKSSLGESLESEEQTRLSRIAGKSLVRNRAMADEAYVAYFDTPTDLQSGELIAQRVALVPDIESAELNVRMQPLLTPNDEFFSLQWSLTSAVAGIRAPQAWDLTTGSSAVVVGVVDTGILGHPEFSGRLLPGIDTITSLARSQDGDGRDSDPTDEGDFSAAGACSPGSAARDSSWHGTHVTGIIGANANNGTGIAGVDWRARIVPVRSLGRCGGDTADIVDGMSWAAGLSVPGFPDNPTPAKVINMSLGGPGTCGAYASTVQRVLRKGAIVVAAAGNSNVNALEGTPASCALVLTVSAVGPSADKASYSNYSAALEISAPGGDAVTRIEDAIASTGATGKEADPGQANYKYQQGTSQAAPHVSGVLSLMLAVAPTLTVSQMRDIIQETARAYPAGSRCATRGDCGPGILDARAAVAKAQSLNGKSTNYGALWWRSNENGWGINLQQQGNVLFGTWFSYGIGGNGVWYVMPAIERVSDDVFFGDIYVTTGVPFNQIAGQPSSRSVVKVGVVNLYFFDHDKAIFLFELGGVVGVKQITHQLFAPPPTCDFTTASRTGLTNYQDLWWNPSESGWGINLAHQGDTIFATWFTYGADGSPMWLVAPDARKSGASYSGTVYRTTGRRPQDIVNEQATLTIDAVGSLTLTFASGESGTMAYTVFGQSGVKPIVRQIWSTPQSTCR